MNHFQYIFVDTAFGDVSHRNKVMDARDVNKALPADKKNCYVTWHRFPKMYQEHCTETGSVKNYRGPSYADFLPFDFDSDDLNISLHRVREFLKMLEVSYEVGGLQGVRVWFSGKKGFHVGLSSALFGGWTPSEDLASKLKTLSKVVGQGFEFDSAIYDQNRMLRMQNTLHGGSELWKIPLYSMEVQTESIKTIQSWASQPRTIEWPDWYVVSPTPPLSQVWESVKKEQQGKRQSPKIAENVFGSGEEGRDVTAFNIARYLRDGGLKASRTLNVLKFWNSKLDVPLTETDGEDILEKKIQNAYGDVLQDEDRIVPEKIMSIEDMANAYTTYIEATKLRKVTLGFKSVDLKLRGIAPGEVCTVIAKSGVGKTAFLQNAILHIGNTQRDTTCVFCSMEQPMAQCFERWAQMVGVIGGEDVEKEWSDPTFRDDMMKMMKPKFGDRVWTIDVPNLKIEEVEQIINMTEEKTGKKVGVLALDYLGMMDATDLDKTIYGQVSRLARGIKNLAKAKSVAIIMLCQVSRLAGEEGDAPLTIHSARESGAIEESADFLLGLYRPQIKDKDNDNKITIQILKNRKGTTGAFTYQFTGETSRITELEEKFGVEYPNTDGEYWQR